LVAIFGWPQLIPPLKTGGTYLFWQVKRSASWLPRHPSLSSAPTICNLEWAVIVGPFLCCQVLNIIKTQKVSFQSIDISVARVVGPSVNTLRAQLIFPSRPNFCKLSEFPTTKFTQKIILFHTLTLKIVEKNLLNLSHQEFSNNTKNTPKFQYSFQFQFYLVFIEKMIQ
jgi:hypothetical protein